jgi:hypothetical protein
MQTSAPPARLRRGSQGRREESFSAGGAWGRPARGLSDRGQHLKTFYACLYYAADRRITGALGAEEDDDRQQAS